MSDGELSQLLSDLVHEVQRRTSSNGRRLSPDLDRALREAASAFAGQAPSAPKLSRGRREQDGVELPEAKRKVIEAALRAGVKPAQVAKHFGVPLAALRQLGAAGK